MKKIFLAILSAMLLFAACGKEDVVNDSNYLNDDVEVVFQSNFGTAPATKAIINTIADLDTKEFGVYAYVNGVDDDKHHLIDNGHYLIAKDVTDPSNIIYKAAATGGEKYFWPKSDNNNVTYTVDFLALYPYTTGAGASYSRSGENVTVTLNSSTVGDESIDVLYAVTNEAKHQTVATYNNTVEEKYYVPLKFKHALSLIEFRGKHAGSNNMITKVKVTKIEFLKDDKTTAYDITTAGNLVFNISTIDKGTNDNPSYVPSTTYDNNTTVNNLNFGNNIDLTTDIKTISQTILIPQNVPNYVRITFDIAIANTTGEEITFKNRQVTKLINDGADMHTTPVTYATAWESGKKYIYTYYITASEVAFDVTIEEWSVNEYNFQVWDKE